jgi:hypothetical protein
MLRAIPEGTATGRILQEVKAADGAGGGESDAALVRAIAQQHAAHAPAEDTAVGDADPGGAKRRRTRVGPARRARRGRRPFVVSVTGALLQYGWGVVVGAFQALVLLFYQWVVDPAADGEWPVRLFAAAASGPLRQQVLRFYGDQTNFTRRLVSVRANAKFAAPDAGPDALGGGRREDLKAVVAHLRGELGVSFVYCWHGGY